MILDLTIKFYFRKLKVTHPLDWPDRQILILFGWFLSDNNYFAIYPTKSDFHELRPSNSIGVDHLQEIFNTFWKISQDAKMMQLLSIWQVFLFALLREFPCWVALGLRIYIRVGTVQLPTLNSAREVFIFPD